MSSDTKSGEFAGAFSHIIFAILEVGPLQSDGNLAVFRRAFEAPSSYNAGGGEKRKQADPAVSGARRRKQATKAAQSASLSSRVIVSPGVGRTPAVSTSLVYVEELQTLTLTLTVAQASAGVMVTTPASPLMAQGTPTASKRPRPASGVQAPPRKQQRRSSLLSEQTPMVRPPPRTPMGPGEGSSRPILTPLPQAPKPKSSVVPIEFPPVVEPIAPSVAEPLPVAGGTASDAAGVFVPAVLHRLPTF